MYRAILFLLALFGPAVVLAGSTGCTPKVTTVQETEQRHESEPQMTSPGKEVVE